MILSNPLWLLFLLPVALWIFAQFRYPHKKMTALPYPDTALIKPWVRQEFNEEKVLCLLKALGLILIVIALARPQMVSKIKEPPKPVVDIILCLDTSMSMAALDFDPDNRLETAKKTAEEFIRKRGLDRIGLIVFGGRAITQCPLTLDHESLINFLKSIELNATNTEGTAVGNAIALASTRLSESEAKSKIIILLTDGRSNAGNIDPVTAATASRDLGIKIYAIGTAVPGGGMVPVEDPLFGKRLAQMAEDLDEPTLQQIARLTSARYFRVTSGKRFKEIYDEIDRMEKTKIETETTENFQDHYRPFLLAALILLSLELLLRNTVWRTVP